MRKLKLFLSMLTLFLFSVGTVWATLPTNPQWEAKALADIADGSTVIIICNSDAVSNVALPSTATNSNPAKVVCTVATSDGVSTITPPSGKTLQDLAWKIEKKTSTWKFWQEGSTTIRLYLTGSSNTALRVGNANSTNDEFVMGALGKLLKCNSQTRYVGFYEGSSSKDWRTYGTEDANNYAKGALTFYVLKVNPSIKFKQSDVEIDTLDFGSVKQHSGTSEILTAELTLEQSDFTAAENVNIAVNGSLFSVYPGVITPSDWTDGKKTISVYASTGDAGSFIGKTTGEDKNYFLVASSGAETPEFANDTLPLKIIITPTFAVSVAKHALDKEAAEVTDLSEFTATVNGVESYYAENGETLNLVAAPKAGFDFVNWTSNNGEHIAITDDTAAETTATVDADVTITANFQEKLCSVLGTPVVTVAAKEYNNTQLTWETVANAESYIVEIWKGESKIEEDNVTDASYTVAAELLGAAEYTYKVQATSSNADYCASAVASAAFTTDAYPAATLTFSENGVERALAGDHKLYDVVTLPTTVENAVEEMSLAGWSTVAVATTDTKPSGETFYEPGAEFILGAGANVLYAVYVAGHAASESWDLATSVAAGDVIVFATDTENSTRKTNGGLGSNTYMSSTNSSFDEGNLHITSLADGTFPFTIGGNATDGWTLANGGKYLYISGDKQISLKTEATTWELSFEGNVAKFTQQYNSSTYTMQYNTSNARFNVYSSVQKPVSLYKHNVQESTLHGYTTSPCVKHSITISDAIDFGDVTADLAKACAETVVTLTATPDAHCRFVEWSVNSGAVTVTDNKFAMPDADVTVSATFEQIKNAITITEPVGGTLSVLSGEDPVASGAQIVEGAVLTVSATPSTGYLGGTIKVIKTGADPEEDVTGAVLSEGNLTMPNYAVTVSASFDVKACEDLAQPALDGEIVLTCNTAAFTWAKVEHAEKYNLAIEGTEINADITEGLTYTAIGLTAGTEYHYVLTAVGDGVDYCSKALEGDFTTPAQPAAPTISVAAGTYYEALSVEITAAGAEAIYYTLDGEEPTITSTPYEGPIAINENKTLRAIAKYAVGMSGIAEAAYEIHIPMTVAEAIELINTDKSATYANRYVVAIISNVESYNSKYSSLTYWISDDGKTNALQVYSGKGMNSAGFSGLDDLNVGDKVIICGDLKWYSSGNKYEFDKNNYLVQHIEIDATPSSIAISGTPDVVKYAENQLFDPTGLVVTAIYNTGYQVDVTDDVEWSNDLEDGKVVANTTVHVTATLGSLNASTDVDVQIAEQAPAFSPVAGTYTSAQDITLTAAEGAAIYYTLEDAEPTILYEGPIALTTRGTHTIKAIAIGTKGESQIVTAEYKLNLPYTPAELVAADLPEAGTENIILIVDNDITGILNNKQGIFLNQKDATGEKDIEIYYKNHAVPTDPAWNVDGHIAGTITGTWMYYSGGTVWELVPDEGFEWTSLTYKAPAGIAWSAASGKAYLPNVIDNVLPTLANPNNLDVEYSSSEELVAEIDAEGNLTINKPGTTVITATFTGNDDYVAKAVSYTLTVYAPEELVITGEPQTEYEYGDAFNMDVLGAKAIYGDDTEYNIPDIDIDIESAVPGYVWEDGKVEYTIEWQGLSADSMIAVTVKTHEVTLAEIAHGEIYLSVAGAALNLPANLVKGTVVDVAALADKNYKLATLTAGETDILAAMQFTVGEADITVSATFEPKPATGLAWKIEDAEVTEAKAYLPVGTVVAALPVLSNPNNVDVVYSTTGDAEHVAEIDDNGLVTVKGAGTVTITASSISTEYAYEDVDYTLTVYAPEELVITGEPQTEYEYGDAFNMDVLGAKAIYGDDTEYNIPDIDIDIESAVPGYVWEDGKVEYTIEWQGLSADSMIAVTVKKHTVSFEHPEHGFISVKLGDDNINSGDAFVKGTELSVVLLGSYDYKAGGLIVTGATLENDLMTIGTENVVISGTVVEKPAAPIAWDIEGTEVNVTLGDWYQFPELVNDQHLDVFYSTTGDAEHVAEIDENGKVTVKGAGTVIITASYFVSVESEYKTTDVSYTLTISEPQPYYMKNSWNEAVWTWKPMTYFAGIYVLQNVVFGGTGVNYNTSDSDQGAQWRPVDQTEENHIILDDGEIAAKDTIDLMLDPQLGTVTATNVRKYVAPAETKFYIAGSMTDWEANMIAVTEDSYTFHNLPAGNHQIKVVDGNNWKGYESVIPTDGLYTDEWGNVDFTLADAGTVTVTYIAGETFTVEGTFGKPESKLIGLKGWTEETDAILMENAAADYETASATVTIETADDYEFKLIFNGMWLGKNYNGESEQVVISRENASVDALVSAGKDINFVYTEPYALKLNADMAGEYTFTWNYVTRTLTITYPELPAVKYYLAGSFGEENAWVSYEMAEDEGVWSYALTLDAKSTYQFKIFRRQLSDVWFGAQDEENEMKYGNSTDWVLTSENGGHNINLKTTTAASYTFEFTPEGNLISVEIPKDATAIDGIDADEKAVKVIHNDMIYIIKGGKTYNITGQLVK